MLIPFIGWGSFWLLCGFFLGYTVTLPFANHYLVHFNQKIGYNLWSLPDYVDYTLFILLANGLICEIGCLVFFLVHYGYLKAQQLIHYRRYAVVLAFILGAVFTPPDILTQMIMAISLLGMYETAIYYARFLDRKESKKGD
jgi:sec-independent protein translocase protein TatC